MASVPAAFPVWLVGANGESVVVLDAISYAAAVTGGAAPFSAVTPSATIASGVTVAELPLSPIQAIPMLDSSAPLSEDF
jgi:hypothetical protein